MQLKLTKKQLYAFSILEQKEYDHELGYEANVIEEMAYGGSAGGGKTDFGASWLLLNCIRYPGSRWFIGRTELKRLKQSTLLTFFQVCARYGFKKDVDFRYNSIDTTIKFINGSEIYGFDLAYYPSDPEFDRFGSLEFTGGFIDESQEIPEDAKAVLSSRLRYKTREFKIRGQIFMGCNPGKNFLYREFYKPYIQNSLPNYKAFIRASVYDNPFIDKAYIQKLKRLPEPLRKKLLDGNWDYADASNALVPFSWLQSALVAERPPMKPNSIRLVGFDVAREGEDNSVIALIVDGILCELFALEIDITKQQNVGRIMADKFMRYCDMNGVGYRNATVDAVGIGVSVIDSLREKNWYVNEYKGGSSIKKHKKLKIERFQNLRTYSHWMFREAIQSGELKIYDQISELDNFMLDVGAYTYNDNDKLIILEKKSEIKKQIGRSPDFLDAVTMAIAPQPMTKFTLVKNY